MLKLNTNFGRYSFRVQLVKRRDSSIASDTTFFPKFADIRSTRSGSKVSRFFRHFFEKGGLRSFLGKNLAAFAIVASVATPGATVLATTGSLEVNTIAADQPFATNVVVQYPLEKFSFNQGYSAYHSGIDLGDPKGTLVKPIMVGKVVKVEYSRFSYGNSVVVDHSNGFGSRYAHLSKIDVKEGDDVDTRTVIGEVGATGNATGNHLHLEVYKDGRTINPLSVLPQ